jgi:molecular chaperone GrpE
MVSDDRGWRDLSDDQTGTNPTPDIEAGSPPISGSTESAHNAAIDELAQMRDRWLRTEAQMAKVISRTQREVENSQQFAVQKFAKDVVETADNLQRGIASLPRPIDREPEMVTRLRDGFTGIYRSFVHMLAGHGIVQSDPTGTTFDPNFHQAVDQQVSTDHAQGIILHALTSAWTLNGRLLRPAMVVVSLGSPDSSPVRQSFPSYGAGG